MRRYQLFYLGWIGRLEVRGQIINPELLRKGCFSINMKAMAAKKRILVVDDEADSRAFTEAVISESGDYEVLSATGGEEGLQIAQTEVPNLIILDMVMP